MKNILVLLTIYILYNSCFGFDYERKFFPDTTVAKGDTIWVEAEFINNASDTIKGLVYSEKIPSAVVLQKVEVKINDTLYTNIKYESDAITINVDNCMTHRWIFQTPTDFHEPGYLIPGDTAKITYGLTINSDTSFGMNKDAWYAGLISDNDLNPIYGYDSLNIIHLTFKADNTKIVPDMINELPTSYSFDQNYPNPFNNRTVFIINLPKTTHAKIEIFNAIGQRMGILLNNIMSSGSHSILFDASEFPSGIYYAYLTAGNYKSYKKLTLLK